MFLLKKCESCGKTGLFLKLNQDGICEQCEKDKEKIIDSDDVVKMLAKALRSSDDISDKILAKVNDSVSAYERITERSDRNFYRILNQFKKARNLEKEQMIDEALEIYLSLIPYRPEGTLYYTRPCIILEKKKRYQEAIEICDVAIQEIQNKKFNADTQEFEHRKERLLKKIQQQKAPQRQ